MRPSPARVFTASWGQLESEGSNLGDEAIFASQLRQLRSLGVELGVLSADPESTAARYEVRPFRAGGSRIMGMIRGIAWSDFVMVGGGELVQDVSSLLYTPFNLLPLRIAWWMGRPSFAWSVGIGKREELAPWSLPQLATCLGRCRGVTVRDWPSRELLLSLGLRPERVLLASDSAFAMTGDYRPGPVDSDILGFAPRNVLNRRGRLLPLELRKKLGMAEETDPSPVRKAWAGLLDGLVSSLGCRIRLFPFHTGSLSNADDRECLAIADMMRRSDRVEMADASGLKEFVDLMSECRVMLAVPLHGSILSVVSGAFPVAVPYASKGERFMSQVGLGDFVLSPPDGKGWVNEAEAVVESAWTGCDRLWQPLRKRRGELAELCDLNLRHFRSTCLGE
jgi:polysaccharide pyruvyl transferase WcaK-like protein